MRTCGRHSASIAARLLLQTTLVLGMGGLSDAGAADGVEYLNDLWTSQRSAVSTARIRMRTIRALGPMTERLTPDEVRSLFSSVGNLEHPDDLAKVVNTLSPSSSPASSRWADTQLLVDRISDRIGESHSYPSGVLSLVYDGDLQTLFRDDISNRQATVASGSRSLVKRISLRDVWLLPDRDLAFDTLAVQSLPNGLVSLSDLQSEWIVDRHSGFVHRWHVALGIEIRESLQFRPVTHADGVVFPALRVNAGYVDGLLTWVELFLVDQVDLNIDFEESAFHVSSPAGVLVVDRTSESGDVVTKRLDRAVDDIAGFVRSGALLETTTAVAPAVRWTTMLYHALVLLTVLLILLWWLRTKTMRIETGAAT
jgi:hypothetical protein